MMQGRSRRIDARKFSGLKRYVRIARDMWREKVKKNPMIDEDPISWKDEEWIKYIINFVRIGNAEMSDEDMAKNPEKVWKEYRSDSRNARYYRMVESDGCGDGMKKMSTLLEKAEDLQIVNEAKDGMVELVIRKKPDISLKGRKIELYEVKNGRRVEARITGTDEDGFWMVEKASVGTEWKTFDRAIEAVRSGAEERMNAFGGNVKVKIKKKY